MNPDFGWIFPLDGFPRSYCTFQTPDSPLTLTLYYTALPAGRSWELPPESMK